MDNKTLGIQIESILFIAGEPLSAQKIAEVTLSDPAAVTAALEETAVRLKETGIRLAKHDDKYQLTTAPESAGVVGRMRDSEIRSELSRPALETVSIIAYRGPITKTQIEQIRGVSSDVTIRNLISRGLVAESGKSSEPGKPLLYNVTHEFLQHFGLTSTADLPPIPDIPDEN